MGAKHKIVDAEMWDAFETWTVDIAVQRAETGIVRSTVGFLHGTMKAHRTSLVLPDDDRHTAQEWFLAEEGAIVPAGEPMPWETTAAADALAKQVSQIADLRRSDFVDCKKLAEHGLRSAIHAPMIVRGQERGVLVLASTDASGFHDIERRITGLVAAVFAAHHEVERLSERWARSRMEHGENARSLHALHRLVERLSQAEGFDDVRSIVAESTHQIVPADRVALILPCDPTGERAEVWALDEASPVGIIQDLNQSPFARVIEENKSRQLGARDLALIQQPPLRSGLAAPISFAGRPWGAILLGSARPRIYTQFQIQILDQLGWSIGMQMSAMAAGEHRAQQRQPA